MTVLAIRRSHPLLYGAPGTLMGEGPVLSGVRGVLGVRGVRGVRGGGVYTVGLRVSSSSLMGGKGRCSRERRLASSSSCSGVRSGFLVSRAQGVFFPGYPVSSSATVSADISYGPHPLFTDLFRLFSNPHFSPPTATSAEAGLPSFSHITATRRAGRPMSCWICSILISFCLRLLSIRRM
jgi:hypothetical protein